MKSRSKTKNGAFFALLLVAAMLPQAAQASIPFVFSGFEIEVGWALCKIVFALQGTIGKALSSLAVIMLALGAFFGKVTWGLAVTVAAGIFVIFGATDIVDMFASDLSVSVGGFNINGVEGRCYQMGLCSNINKIGTIPVINWNPPACPTI